MSALIRSSRFTWDPAPSDRAAIAEDEGWTPSPRAARAGRFATDDLGFVVKRAVDLVGAFVGLIVLAPVLLERITVGLQCAALRCE
jgi:hypothetical protein